ncbi:MAG: CsbD family protein [Croceibacterium sp.]
MGELKDRAKGAVNRAVGGAKQESANPETRAEGRAQQRKGEGQDVVGKIKGALGDDI